MNGNATIRGIAQVRTLAEIADDIALGITPLDEAVTELADANRLDDLAELLERRIALPREEGMASLSDRAELPAALLCRAAGLGLNGYSAVLRMRRRVRRDASVVPGALLSAYSGIPRPTLEELQRHLAAKAAESRQAS
jgi:hypothetical protein